MATASGVESHRSYYSKFDKELNKTIKIYSSYLTKAAHAIDGSSWSGDLKYTCIPKRSNTWLKIDFETVKVVHHFYFHGITSVDLMFLLVMMEVMLVKTLYAYNLIQLKEGDIDAAIH